MPAIGHVGRQRRGARFAELAPGGYLRHTTSLCSDLLRMDPNNPDAYYIKGVVAYHQGINDRGTCRR